MIKALKTDNYLIDSAIGVALAAGGLLLIPLIAMQFTEEVAWSGFDFALAWVLLAGAGFTFKLLIRNMGTFSYRAGVALAVGTALFMVWANLAVGLIGSENNPANLIYGGVLAVGFIGVLASRFRPRGMAFAAFGMAIATALIAVIALFGGMHQDPYSSVMEILGVNGFFVALFLVAGLLLMHAAEGDSDGGAE